jgi:hypothetical protein
MIRDSSDPPQSRSSLGGVFKTFEMEAGHLVNQSNLISMSMYSVLRGPHPSIIMRTRLPLSDFSSLI